MKNLIKNPSFTVSAALLASVLGYGVHAARAGGIPPTNALTYAGLLEDGTGAALTGSHNIEVKVWDAATAGNQLCDVNPGAATSIPDGRFQIQLTDDCTTGVHANATTWTEVFLDGMSLGRSANGAVPYAAEAQHAVTADATMSAADAVVAITATYNGPDAGMATAQCPAGYRLAVTSLTNVQLTDSGVNGWPFGVFGCSASGGVLTAGLGQYANGSGQTAITCSGLCIK